MLYKLIMCNCPKEKAFHVYNGVEISFYREWEVYKRVNSEEELKNWIERQTNHVVKYKKV